MNSHAAIHFGFRGFLFAAVLALLWLAPGPTSLYAQAGDRNHAVDGTGIYEVRFTASWSEQTHPHPNNAFPSASAHFSPLIGAVHGPEVTFWRPDALASDGIEQMAETGGTSILRAEIDDAIAAGSALSVISGGAANSPGSVEIGEIELSADFAHVTLVTMIAPSPDWFVGISGESLLDEEGEWVSARTFTLYPYDAGTDDGADYISANADTVPAELIQSLRNQTPFSDAPIGTFTFTRIVESKQAIYLPWVAR